MGKQTFSTAGSDTFDVPNGVTSITVKAWGGGAGGAGGGDTGGGVGGAGGGAGYVQGDITVTPEEELSILVGGKGEFGTFQNISGGGGGGAGLSSVTRGGTPLFIVGAGAGGGGGDNSDTTPGGSGGSGGDSTGDTGGSSLNADGGGGGTQIAGGAAGTGGQVSGDAGGAPITVAANFGNCLDFDGTDEFVSTANSYSNPQTFTIELWFKTTTESGGLLVGFEDSQTGASTSYDRRIWVHNDGKISCGVWVSVPTGVVSVSSTASYNDGEWHHVAMTHDSGGFELFIDGISQGTNANASGDTGANYWRLAGTAIWTDWPNIPTDNYYVGQIDEVRFWQEVRTLCQLRNNANVYLAGTETNLAFYYKLNEASGTNANDETSNNNDGTLQNMEDADWVTSTWSAKWISVGVGGNGGDGNDGGATKGGEANGGIYCAGSGGTADVGANGFGGGGGGGCGYAGGGGGSSSQSGDAGGGGGGGGSSYIIGSATLTTNTQGSGQNPPNTGDPDYTGSVGVGGDGGTTTNDGFDGFDGLVVILWTDPPAYIGFKFVGSSSQYLSSVSSFTPPTECSVTSWLYLTELNQFGRLITRATNWVVGMADAVAPTPNALINGLNSGDLLLSATSLQANTLYHIVCTGTDSDRQIFINGVLDASGGGGTPSTAGTLTIGSTNVPDFYLSGHLEDMRVYDRVLTLAEVQTIYACRSLDGIVHGLLHRWLLNEGAIDAVASGVGVVKDIGSGQLNMTPNNSPVYSGSQMIYRRKYRTH